MELTLAELITVITATHEASASIPLTDEQPRCLKVLEDTVEASLDCPDSLLSPILDTADVKYSMEVLRVFIGNVLLNALQLQLESIIEKIYTQEKLHESLVCVLSDFVLGRKTDTFDIVKGALDERLEECNTILRTLKLDQLSANEQLAAIYNRETTAASNGNRRCDYRVDAPRDYEGGGYDGDDVDPRAASNGNRRCDYRVDAPRDYRVDAPCDYEGGGYDGDEGGGYDGDDVDPRAASNGNRRCDYHVDAPCDYEGGSYDGDDVDAPCDYRVDAPCDYEGGGYDGDEGGGYGYNHDTYDAHGSYSGGDGSGDSR